MATIITPNMLLPTPIPGQEAGPQYAIDNNNCFTLVDAHDHSSGKGVQISPAGININSTLQMNDNALGSTAAITLVPQTSFSTLNSIYELGVDLYYRDGNNNQVRITQGGAVTGAAGTITGLPSGTASASYAGGTFTFQAATATAANIDAGSYIFRNNTPNSFGLTLQPPNAMGANYSLTLPSLPSSDSIMTLDTSGNMGSTPLDNVTIVNSGGTIHANESGILAFNVAPTQQIFPSGSGNYILPTSPRAPLYIVVTMAGGGGGGGGIAGDGGDGGTTTFGTAYVCNGGEGGTSSDSRGFGGTASISFPATGLALKGGDGGGPTNNSSAGSFFPGGMGGSNPLGGAGGGRGGGGGGGSSGSPNTGAGGGGTGPAGPQSCGGGGGAGGYIKAFIANPASTYAYSVGAAGIPGASTGGSGVIIIDEYYQ